MINLLKLILFLIFLLLLGCSEEDSPVTIGTVPIIESINAADKWNPRLARKYKIEVSVNDPQGPDNIRTVIMDVKRDTSGLVIFTDSLYDDGAYYHSEDGDVIAGDGVYSNRFLPTQISSPVQSGLYFFQFIALDRDGNQSPDIEYAISFGDNRAPEIINITGPDSFSVNLLPGIIQVTVNDSDGVDDIDQVYFESQKAGSDLIRFEGNLYNDGDPAHGDMIAGDDIYSTVLDTAFVVGKKGEYDLLFHVVDTFNEKNQVVPRHYIRLHNKPPEISDIQIPDSIAIPNEGEFIHEALKAIVEDAEGLTDIDSVYFYSFRNDTALFNGKPVLLKDNGEPFNYSNYIDEVSSPGGVSSVGDEFAGDGAYTFPLVIESYFKPGTYIFRFYTKDKAGNLFGPEVKMLTVFKQE